MRLLKKLLAMPRGRSASLAQSSPPQDVARSRGSLSVADRVLVTQAVDSLVASGRFADALETVDRALNEHPGDGEWLFARGSTLFAWGRYIEARKSFREAE